MKDADIRAYIDLAVKRSIEEYKKAGLFKGSDDAIYSDASEILKNYFETGQKDARITYAIQGLRFDPYFRILDLYYSDRRTIDQIAGEMGVDSSTVVRNKKRLCLAIYHEII